MTRILDSWLRRPQDHFASLIGQGEEILKLLYFDVQRIWLIKVELFYRTTPRIFLSYYMAHTLRYVIIETKLHNFKPVIACNN